MNSIFLLFLSSACSVRFIYCQAILQAYESSEDVIINLTFFYFRVRVDSRGKMTNKFSQCRYGADKAYMSNPVLFEKLLPCRIGRRLFVHRAEVLE